MGYFLLFQIAPLALVWIVFAWLDRFEAFRRLAIPVILVAGAMVQLTFWFFSHPNLDNPDSLGFFRLGHGLETDLRAILFRPKLYPIFLGYFVSLKTAALVQCLLKLAMSFFLLRLSKLLAWRPGSAAFVIFLFLFNTIWLREPLRILDTTLFAFLFTAYLWLALETITAYSPARFMAFCMAGGLTTLTRQSGDLVLALVGVSVVAVLLAGSGNINGNRAPLRVPWFPIFLGALIGSAGLIQNGLKYGVCKRTVAVGTVLYTHMSFYELSDPSSPEWAYVKHYLPDAQKQMPHWRTAYANDIPWAVNALPHELERAMKPYDRETILACDRELSGRFFLWAKGNPAGYLASIGNEVMRLLWKSEEYYPESLIDKVMDAPVSVLRMERGVVHQSIGLLFCLGLIAFVWELRKRSAHVVPLCLLLAGAGGSILLIAAVLVGFTRYTLPMIPCLLVAACHLFDRLADVLLPSRPRA